MSVDLVVDPAPPEDFEVLTPATRLDVAGLACSDYVTNVSEVRVAEKVCAIMQTYATGPSSRVKDLADLVISMLNETISADKLARRLSIEVSFRHMSPICEFAVPAAWKTTFSGNYRKMAKEAKLPRKFGEVSAAEAAVADWMRPVLKGEAKGCAWNPEEQTWI